MISLIGLLLTIKSLDGNLISPEVLQGLNTIIDLGIPLFHLNFSMSQKNKTMKFNTSLALI